MNKKFPNEKIFCISEISCYLITHHYYTKTKQRERVEKRTISTQNGSASCSRIFRRSIEIFWIRIRLHTILGIPLLVITTRSAYWRMKRYLWFVINRNPFCKLYPAIEGHPVLSKGRAPSSIGSFTFFSAFTSHCVQYKNELMCTGILKKDSEEGTENHWSEVWEEDGTCVKKCTRL